MIRLWMTLFLLTVSSMSAHEVRPAYLELRETAENTYAVTWKVPARGNLRLRVEPLFPAGTEVTAPKRGVFVDGAFVERWEIQAKEGFGGKKVAIAGLELTLIEVLLRLEFLSGASLTERLSPQQPIVTLPEAPSAWDSFLAYFFLGVEHILFGIDHLLFVLVIVLLLSDTWNIVKAISSFTVAHSITLAIASLELVAVPSAPVEALIALSIVLVAAEALGKGSSSPSLLAAHPWLGAFLFGLLHGFGFAGALLETGLPANAIPLALAGFNLGVEAGQLLFIAAILGIIRRLEPYRLARVSTLYFVGSVGAFWFLQRSLLTLS